MTHNTAREERDEPYCRECGCMQLAYIRTVANGDEWQCKDCGHLSLWDSVEDDE